MQYDRQLTITTGQNRKSTTWTGQSLNWSDFVARLSKPIRTQETFAEYRSWAKPQQDDLKDVGGFVGGSLTGARRKNENAGERHLITLDADTIEPGGTQRVLSAVSSLRCAYAVYSTRKHESAAPRLRIILPLDIACSADEYEPIARKIASFIGMEIFDPTTFEPVRLMYWPSCSCDSEYVFCYEDLPFVSKDGILAMYWDWRNVTEWPEVPGAAKIKSRSAKKQGDPLEKKGIVGAFCKHFSIVEAMERFLPGIYEPCADPNRFTFCEGSTVGGAVLYEEKFLYSHHATDPCSGKLCNAFDMVRLHLFGEQDDEAKPDTPVGKLPSFQSMAALAADIPEVSGSLAKERYDAAVSSFQAPMQNITAEDADWIAKLEVHPKTGIPTSTVHNIQLILEHDPRLQNRLYYDCMSGRLMVCQSFPWEPQTYPYPIREWREGDDSGLVGYLEQVYKIAGDKKASHALNIYAINHSVHRLKDYLNNLVWDGVPRLDTLLIDYFGAVDNIYTRETIRKTLVGAVARIMQPGVKFEPMLILAGKQGCGKSTFFRFLGLDWFSDSLTTFEGKEAAELLQGYWILEVGELDGFNRSEMTTIKQFLSRQEDVYRAAYGRKTEIHPRQCIIVGTTNESEFLKDVTGGRRFWPVDLGVAVSSKNVWDNLRDEVPQIWAEAVLKYRLGEPLILSSVAEGIAAGVQETHMEASYAEGLIKEFLNQKITKGWYTKTIYQRKTWLDSDFDREQAAEGELVPRNRICALEIWNECYKMPGHIRMKKSDAKEINNALMKLEEWEKLKSGIRFGGEYGNQRGFKRKGIDIED
jgi:predicted P-loop ATPase